MAQFLVESYVSRSDASKAFQLAERAGKAANELTGEGTPVSLLGSFFVPEDETCFLFYEAVSPEVVRAAARRADLAFERVAAAISKGGAW